MEKAVIDTGGVSKLFYGHESAITRIAYFADVYGRVKAVTDGIWNNPELAHANRSLLRLANIYRDKPYED